LRAGATAYSKGENYAEKRDSAFGCDGFGGFRKFNARVCGEQPFSNAALTTDKLQIDLAV
jgi:hypothetical protein